MQSAYRLLFERNPLPMLVYESDSGLVLYANEAAARCYGHSVQQLVALHFYDLHQADEWQALQQSLKLQPEQRERNAWRQLDRQGNVLHVELDTQDIDLHGKHARIVLVHDVTKRFQAEQARKELTERLQSTLESITDAFFTVDHEARFTYVNQRAEALLGRTRQELLGRVVWDCFPDVFGTEHQVQCERAIHTGEPVYFEAYYASCQLWHDIRVYPSAQGLAVYFRDVTRRHMDDEQIRQQRERLNAIVNASSEAIISTDAEGRIQTFNPGAEQVFGYQAEAIFGQTICQLLPERYRGLHTQQLAAYAASGEKGMRMMGLRLLKGLHADGREIDLEGSMAQVMVGKKQVLISILRDVTERNAADAERQAARTQLSHLTHRLMSQEKDLVKRIARVLHDQLGQTIGAIRIVHDTMAALGRGKTSRELQRLDLQMQSLIDQAIRQVRVVLVDLQPPLLEESGLVAALDNEMRIRALRGNEMNLVFQVAPELTAQRWESTCEYAVFMIAREALENAVRHSGASTVVMTLSGDATHLALEVQDNGRGVEVGSASKIGHLGMAGIMERANSIGATVDIRPAQGGGTCVGVKWAARP